MFIYIQFLGGSVLSDDKDDLCDKEVYLLGVDGGFRFFEFDVIKLLDIKLDIFFGIYL